VEKFGCTPEAAFFFALLMIRFTNDGRILGQLVKCTETRSPAVARIADRTGCQ